MKNVINSKLTLLFGLLLALGANVALALTLDEAKAQGLVGEKVDGYVAAVTASPNAEVQQLVSTTNNGRRDVYADLAKKNGITVEQVGIVSAEKLRANAKRGEFVQQTSGQWQQKP
jgi:uncharacterized protein YdbL (DUF1318 family)